MRKYNEETEKKLIEIKCNKCGRDITVDNGIIKEGTFSIAYGWGYFSEKDGHIHSFDLCEKCYDEYTKTFIIPVDIEERNEIV